MTHTALELHDSLLIAITEVGTQAIVLLNAYLHKSEGRPAWDAGSGYIQAVALTFGEAIIEGEPSEFPLDIYVGKISIDGEILSNTFPIPFCHTGEIVLTLQVGEPSPVIVRGKQVILTLIGEAVYVEEFPGAAVK